MILIYFCDLMLTEFVAHRGQRENVESPSEKDKDDGPNDESGLKAVRETKDGQAKIGKHT